MNDVLKPRLRDLDFWWRLFLPLRALSPVFGHLFGDLRLRRRHGRLAGDREGLAAIAATLQPLDILLERSRYRLTDRVIPGYFNHAGLYLGASRDWGTGPAAPARPAAGAAGSEGTWVLEAVRSGVRLQSVQAFLDVDELLVLRDLSLDGRLRRELLARALAQLGKAYDYAFDLRDGERQFCSKLVAEVFGHRRFGSDGARPPPTLLPDHLAAAALAADSTLVAVFASIDGCSPTPAPSRDILAAVLAPASAA